MAPQEHIPMAASVLGMIGTTAVNSFWCIQLIPQIWTNYRLKTTEGLPNSMLFLWSAAGVPLGIYNVVQNFNLPLQVQPQIFCAFALICWGQDFVYKHGMSVKNATALVVCTAIGFAGIEALGIDGLKARYILGDAEPRLLGIGAISAIMLALGLVFPYVELWKRQGRCIGINFLFLGMDWSGAFFSLMALVAQRKFDLVGGIGYIFCLALETGIFTSHAIWMVRTRRTRAAAKAANMTYDEYIADAEPNEKQSKLATEGSTTNVVPQYPQQSHLSPKPSFTSSDGADTSRPNTATSPFATNVERVV